MLRSFLIIASLVLATGCRATVATLPFPLEVVKAAAEAQLGGRSRSVEGKVRLARCHDVCGTGAAITALFTLGLVCSGADTTDVELEAVPEGTRVAVRRARHTQLLWFLPIVSRRRDAEAQVIDGLAERLCELR